MENRRSNIDAEPTETEKARFTFLIGSDQKELLEAICAAQRITCSHAVRWLIGEYLRRHGVPPP